MSSFRSIAVVALVLLGLPATAGAAPGWSVPTTFPLPSNAFSSSVHIGYQTGGTATLAYLEVASESPIQTVLHIGVVTPGGGYQEQLRIASTSISIPTDLSFAEAPDGAAVVEWVDSEGLSASSPVTYMASYRAAGSSDWEAPVTIASEPTHSTEIHPTMVPAISTDGTAAAGLDYFDPADSPVGAKIAVAVHPPVGPWGATEQISPALDSSEGLVLAFDSGGDLTAAFRMRMTNLRFTLAAVRRPASSGIWGSVEDVTHSDPTSEVEGPALGVAPDGSAVIAFQYVHNAGPKTLDVNAVTRPGENAPWTNAVDVAEGGASSGPLAAGVAPNDRAYILYRFQGKSSAESCLGVVRAVAGSTFSAPQCVSPTNFEGYSGGLTFIGEDAYFAWSGEPEEGAGAVVQGSRWLGGTSQPEVFTNLDSPGEKPQFRQITPDEDGSVAAFWAAGTALKAAAYDAGPPILLGSSIPTSAVAGQPVSFTANFFDLWSGLGAGQPTWSFGDGSATVSGASVTHTFATPGVYTITLSAADALGNAASTTRTITVTGVFSSPPSHLTRPTVTVAPPACPKKLSKKACKRYLTSTRAWRSLSGKVTAPAGPASVQVIVYLTRGKTIEALTGKRFHKTTKAKALKDFISARVNGVRWSLTLPKLKPGSYTIMVRASDRAKDISATVTKTIKLE
jgi:PKD domain